ncbi:endonuclease III [Bifidobacterium tsurumiense]|uniref:Endonuclease III n=1 Tax=Bifidobacterium tsurumiense TaxID=356829 RepID=A0A087EHY8_9BIFI|nr:endonuclease III [Bifidobacterium tsurumiense]KFJ07389.1 endonuclease III [Bifidobacterium tsurumiense]
MPRESRAQQKARMQQEYALLCEEIPDPQCALDFTNPFELLVATVLSAQTTDKRVNMVTPPLFASYPSPEELAAANPEIVENIIHSLGFYRSKSRNIIALSHDLMERFDGEVPSNMEDLVTLPGVGRKTANVVLGNAFGIPGFPVDTHVIRVTGRLRWREDWKSTNPDPVHIEKEITSYFPAEEWTDLSHRLILHGRAICHARTPDCAHCPLQQTCPSAFHI